MSMYMVIGFDRTFFAMGSPELAGQVLELLNKALEELATQRGSDIRECGRHRDPAAAQPWFPSRFPTPELRALQMRSPQTA